MMKTFVLTLLFGQMMVLAQSIQVPKEVPPGPPTLVAGTLLRNVGMESRGLDISDMLSLTYAEDEIPGFAVLVSPAARRDPVFEPAGGYTHTRITINGRDADEIQREWFSVSALQAYQQGAIEAITRLRQQGCIRITVRVYSRPAREIGQTVAQLQRSSSAILHRGTPSGHSLGEENFYLRNNRGGGTLWFVYDRATVLVEASSSLQFAEALAQGVYYRLMMHPKRVVTRPSVPRILAKGKRVDDAGLTVLDGVTVIPVSALKAFGVAVQTQRTAQRWQATLQHGNRWVQVEAFSWIARTPDGEVRLERAVFPHKGELVVPLRQVADAIGLTVETF